MIYLIFILTVIATFFLLKNRISITQRLSLNDFINLEKKFKDLTLEEKQLKEENQKREEDVNKIMNLYEITKDIGEFLEEDKIFLNFKNGIKKIIHFDDCKYLEKIDAKEDLVDFEVFSLKSNTTIYGYLAVKGLNQNERPLLDILIAQFIIGLRRAKLYKRVQELSITDSLTKTFTRRYCLERFNEELQRSQELNLSLSFLMLDIDNFKSFNDKYGHLVGDVILKDVAEIIKSNCREIDLIGRFGGEEFMVILPMTAKDGALFAAERIRKTVESKKIKAFDESLNVTVSVGVASYIEDAKTSQELIDKADWALYRSKQTGKNKVTAFSLFK